MLTVRQAIEQAEGSAVTVRGYVVETAGATYLADLLAETYPPQPGGAVLRIEGLDVGGVAPTEHAGDTTWTTGQHTLTGRLEAGTLHVR